MIQTEFLKHQCASDREINRARSAIEQPRFGARRGNTHSPTKALWPIAQYCTNFLHPMGRQKSFQGAPKNLCGRRVVFFARCVFSPPEAIGVVLEVDSAIVMFNYFSFLHQTPPAPPKSASLAPSQAFPPRLPSNLRLFFRFPQLIALNRDYFGDATAEPCDSLLPLLQRLVSCQVPGPRPDAVHPPILAYPRRSRIPPKH